MWAQLWSYWALGSYGTTVFFLTVWLYIEFGSRNCNVG
jgi:hypothetical protein